MPTWRAAPFSDSWFRGIISRCWERESAEGRPLFPGDASAPGSGAVMVISYDAWKNKFGADPNLVGKTLHLRGHAFEVVGIANPAFAGLESFPAASGFLSPWTPWSRMDAICWHCRSPSG